MKLCRKPGLGKNGNPIPLRANHFEIEIQKLGVIHQYRINITPDKCPRKINREIIGTLMRQYQEVFQAIRPVFDGRSNMYTNTPLPIGRAKMEFPVDLSKDRQFQVSIEWVSEISLEFLQAALNGEIHRIPLNAVNAFDIVLRHLPSMQHVPVGRSFFSVPATKSYPLSAIATLRKGPARK